MDIKTLIELAEVFGIPLIRRGDIITLIGEKQLLIFTTTEETQCQLTEIY